MDIEEDVDFMAREKSFFLLLNGADEVSKVENFRLLKERGMRSSFCLLQNEKNISRLTFIVLEKCESQNVSCT